MGAGTGFAGRRGELARFKTALAGDARLLLVVGDAGVGKTRFAAEALRAAADDGAIAAWGNCLPLAEKLPLLPVIQALGEVSRLEDGRPLAEALGACPAYARSEIARLIPRLPAGVLGGGDQDGAPEGGVEAGGWQRDRLFSAVTDVLGVMAARSPLVLVVEDVHWADGATLDCLTYLLRARHVSGMTLVVTCRGDEAPLDQQVASWLAHVRGSGPVDEVTLKPLSRAEANDQIIALAGGPVPAGLADDVYARAEGNPFFAEQLVTAALAGAGAGSAGLDAVPPAMPGRLAELLLTRARRCDPDGQAVLAALSVAGRPLDEAALADVTRQDAAAVRRGLHALATARLLAEPAAGTAVSWAGRRLYGPAMAIRPRHALLAEAVAGALLPGERAALHERTAAMLESAADDTLAAEAAGHWLAAGRPEREVSARVTAGQAAARVFAYAEAAAHFQRAITLYHDLTRLGGLVAASPSTGAGSIGTSPQAAGARGLPALYVQAVDALVIAGDNERAEALAEEAYSLFAGHQDRPTAAAVIMHTAGPLLVAGMRACADLAAAARACRDEAATAEAMTAAAGLVSWVGRLTVAPFAELPGLALSGAQRASWEAERSRLASASDPAAWAAAAKTWGGVEHVHQAAYAWWRQAEAMLDAGHPAAAATAVLQAAAKAAEGHAPLLAHIRLLAERARILLVNPPGVPDPDAERVPAGPGPANGQARHGLTNRELSVLRLLARGRTNAQIGAELYMSPKTASVHVSSIYRKLGVSGRAQAAAVAERAGLLDSSQA